jgi:hypothetical protein
MCTIIHCIEAATAFSSADSSLPCLAARGVARPAINGAFQLSKFTQLQLVYANYECFASSVSVPYVFGECAMHHIALYSFVLLYLISQSSFWHFGCFSFRLWNRQWCVHIHATDPSVAMHRVVYILFVLCLVPVSEHLASIGPLAENCNKLKASHSMRRGAGRGKPDGLKRLPIALGFKCVECTSPNGMKLNIFMEFNSWCNWGLWQWSDNRRILWVVINIKMCAPLCRAQNAYWHARSHAHSAASHAGKASVSISLPSQLMRSRRARNLFALLVLERL